MQKYSPSEFVKNIYALTITKLFYRPARFIRRPIYMRGKESICYRNGLTLGYSCRFDLPGKRKTLFIGENCEFGDNVHIVAHEKVKIGKDVLIASKVFISDTNHGNYKGEVQDSPYTHPNNRILVTKPVYIGDRVWIGENVVILPGVTIEDGCIIGANSVVNTDIKKNTMVAGSPARVIKIYDEKEKKWLPKS